MRQVNDIGGKRKKGTSLTAIVNVKQTRKQQSKVERRRTCTEDRVSKADVNGNESS